MPDNSIFKKVDVNCMELFGAIPSRKERLAASGSARHYYRLIFPDKSLILCVSDNIEENKTFIALSHYLYNNEVNVPEIYKVDSGYKWYLLQDLGDTDFLSMLSQKMGDKFKGDEIENIFRQLVKFQFLPEGEWKNLVEFPQLDRELIFYDFNYAVNNLFIVSGLKYDERGLNTDFEKLASKLQSLPQSLWGLMYRDFQSRNIMIYEGKPYFIDYQSARKGPCIYDFVSFAWQAKAGFSNNERIKLTNIYVDCLKTAGVKAAENVKEHIPYWALFRIIQTLGAYGLRGLKEGKPHFIQSIPPAVGNARELMETSSLSGEFPEIYSSIKQLVNRYEQSQSIKV